MKASGRLNALATLPPDTEPAVPIEWKLVVPKASLDSFLTVWNRSPYV